jgi:hypothetical protein
VSVSKHSRPDVGAMQRQMFDDLVAKGHIWRNTATVGRLFRARVRGRREPLHNHYSIERIGAEQEFVSRARK